LEKKRGGELARTLATTAVDHKSRRRRKRRRPIPCWNPPLPLLEEREGGARRGCGVDGRGCGVPGAGMGGEWRERASAEAQWMSILSDHFEWILDNKSGRYTTRSMHRRLTFRGFINKRKVKLWGSRLPNKSKVFAWMAI